MINRTNIVEYISFLYQKKFNQPATQDLLDSWSGLNDNETAIHLNGLYRHWNLDAISSKNYEQEFLNRSQAAPHTPMMPTPPPNPSQTQQQQAFNNNPSANQQQYYNPPPPKQKSSSNGWIIGIIVALVAGAAGYYYWQLSNKDTSAPPDVLATNANVKPVDTVVKSNKPETIVPKQEQTPADEKNARVIHDLLYAEGNRNFDQIYASFDPNLERYWSINYPTYDELKTEYEKTWSKTENNEHSNVRVNKVSTNTYDVMSTYSYFSLKDQKQKRVNSKVRFVFNNDNKIIKSYGL